MDHQRAQLTYKNRLCVAVHKGSIYRIVDVTDITADCATFEKSGETLTVTQYFRDAYNENVEGKQVVQVKEVRGGSRLCYLPANLLRIIAQAPPVRPCQEGFVRSRHSTALCVIQQTAWRIAQCVTLRTPVP